ncbi:alanine racemase [Galbibacter marinus]|uniref:Alanine racemase n=1 Tax=Galbibacter marinus TaxID=555500 RepID=K2P779_9FLAO|nr:alanine racemase [Galbibacter marinus]EKF56838.1 alanine racemase [Galbibacter marinus]
MTKIQETTLEINLPSLKANYHHLRSNLNPNTKFMAVVKAYAYGSDSCEIALYLENLGVDYFAVAYTKEGIRLREAGVKTPIVVLHPLQLHFKDIIKFNLQPSIYSYPVLESFLKVGKQENQYPVHLKFNTGLNRLGFNAEDLPELLKKFKAQSQLKIASVFSHLGASEDINEKDFTLNQIKAFKEIRNEIISMLSYRPLFHLLNTSGILNYSREAEFDMVRSGIGLYGFGNDPQYNLCLTPIASLKSIISQIHHLKPGESVGYNRGHVASVPMTTATIPIGHADGISRQYGQRNGFLTLHGKRCPIVGNVCMDMLMIDVSGVDCKAGDEVVIFGPEHSAAELASTASTISYELITAVSQRITRKIVY